MEFGSWLKATGTSIRGAWTAIKGNKKRSKEDNEDKDKVSVKGDGSTSHSETADSASPTNSNKANEETKHNKSSGSELSVSDTTATEQPALLSTGDEVIQAETSNSTMVDPSHTNDPTIQSNPIVSNSQPNINNPIFTSNPVNTNNPTNTNNSTVTNNTNVSITPVANIVIGKVMVEPQQVIGLSENNAQAATLELEWVRTNPADALYLQHRAIIAGQDIDGSDIWVIRTIIESEIRPAKFSTGKKEAFVALLSGKEKRIYHFEVCCLPSGKKIPITWKRASDENFPENAVVGGETSDGEPLYIGRQLVGRSRCPGMIRPDNKILYLSYGFEVYEYETYDVLCIS